MKIERGLKRFYTIITMISFVFGLFIASFSIWQKKQKIDRYNEQVELWSNMDEKLNSLIKRHEPEDPVLGGRSQVIKKQRTFSDLAKALQAIKQYGTYKTWDGVNKEKEGLGADFLEALYGLDEKTYDYCVELVAEPDYVFSPRPFVLSLVFIIGPLIIIWLPHYVIRWIITGFREDK